MASDWLYPLSSTSGYWFKRSSGKRTADTGPSSFEQMILEGAVDDDWGAYRNWKKLRKNDRVWVYYGQADGDIGVVGLGHVASVEKPLKPKDRAIVKIVWDTSKTKQLLKHPFPARFVRKYIPRPLAAMWEIGPALARRLADHTGSSAHLPSVDARTSYANGKTSTITYQRPKVVTVHRRHDALLRPLLIRLQASGWKESKVDVQTKRVDLAMRLGRQTLIVEAKTVNSDTSQEVRSAFAQLEEYAWRLQRGSRNQKRRVMLWALFEKQPTSDEIQFLEDHAILVSWATPRAGRIVHSVQTAKHPTIRRLGD